MCRWRTTGTTFALLSANDRPNLGTRVLMVHRSTRFEPPAWRAPGNLVAVVLQSHIARGSVEGAGAYPAQPATGPPYPRSRWTETTSFNCSIRLITLASWATDRTWIVAVTTAV